MASAAGNCSASTLATSPIQVSSCTVSKVQGTSPLRPARKAVRVASRPRPRQVVAV